MRSIAEAGDKICPLGALESEFNVIPERARVRVPGAVRDSSAILYALIRPRLGAGPKTAVTAGLLVWVLAYVYSSVGITAVGIFSATLPLARHGLGTLRASDRDGVRRLYGEASSQ